MLLPEKLLPLLHQVEKNMFPADAAVPGFKTHRWYCRCCCCSDGNRAFSQSR